MTIPSKSNKRLYVLFSVIALDLIGFGVVVPILPFYAVQYGASATFLGLILMSYSGMQFLFSPIWGRLSDRFGRKRILLLSMLGSCLSLVLLSLANSLWLILIARLLGGCFAANISVATACVTDMTTDEDRSKGMGLIGAAFGIGFVLGPALGGGLAPYGYSVPLLVASGLTLLNVFYGWFVLVEPERHLPTEEVIKPAVLSSRPIRRLCLLYFLFTLSLNQLEAVFAFYMMDRFGYDARTVAMILVLMAVVMILVQGGGIRPLTRRFGEVSLMIVGTLVVTLSFLSLPLVGLLLIPLCLISFGRGITQPSMMSLVSKEAAHHQRGAVMGTFQASASLGRVLGPLMAGILYDRWQGGPFYVAALLMGVVFLITLRRSE